VNPTAADTVLPSVMKQLMLHRVSHSGLRSTVKSGRIGRPGGSLWPASKAGARGGSGRLSRTIVASVAACLLAGCDGSTGGRGSLAEEATTAPATPAPDPATPGNPAGSGDPPGPESTVPSTPTAPAGTIPAEWAGTWTGIVNQPASVLPQWTAVVVLPGAQPAGALTVDGRCRAEVRMLAATTTRLVARTVTISDPGVVCAAAGTATMVRISDDQASLTWIDADHAENVATGTLTRR
jgi:hypothetical protein